MRVMTLMTIIIPMKLMSLVTVTGIMIVAGILAGARILAEQSDFM